VSIRIIAVKIAPNTGIWISASGIWWYECH